MAETSTFYVGGGGDGYLGRNNAIVQRYALRQRRSRFFMHFQSVTLQRAMTEAKAQGDALVLIGHSWGGDTVIDLMRDPKTPKPDLIVTVDPVGRSASFGLGRSNHFGGLWVNITATDDAMAKTGGNLVAGLWGKTSRLITARADVQIDANRTHEDFAEMLADARVPEMIPSIRANAVRR